VQHIKLTLGKLLLIVIAFILAISSIHPDNEKIIKPAKSAKKSLADVQEEQLYHFQKDMLASALEYYFEKAIKAGDIVGVGVSITKGDSILISDGFGKRAFGEDEMVNGETVFRLGSLSKGFAGVLAANLKNEGILDWNDKVVDYLPEFELGDEGNTQSIKISHILSHTSGAPYHSFTNLVEAGLPMSKIAARFNEINPISEAGIQYSYQNAMFALSQEVMYKATGENIQDLLSDRFFEPLGMFRVSMDNETLMSYENIAIPHRKTKTGWNTLKLTDRYDNAVAAGGVNASSEDMAKWMRFLLGHKPEVMKFTAIKEVFQPMVTYTNRNKYYQRWPGHLDSSYGFGWRIHTFENEETGDVETIWHHGGSVNSFRNEIALYPESDLGICVLINSNSKLAKSVIPHLRKIIKMIYQQSPNELTS